MTSVNSEALVEAQYEQFPYPERDPEDERRRLIGTWLDHLDILNHHCFRGEYPFRRGFRVLIAGGGTGDGTIFLAHQLRATDAEVIHLDLSSASIEIARKRAAIHGFTNIRWVQASLLDLPTLGLGRFDFINCVGVLHHLVDPEAGLDALLSALADDGAMAILLYAQYGRTGVYQMQSLLRLVNQGVNSDGQKIENARVLLRQLPRTNWFRRGEDLFREHEAGGDAGLYDLLLHSQDRAYTVPELYDWLVDRRGLRIQFSDVHRGQLPYQPETYLANADPGLLTRIHALPQRDQQAIAELLGGDIVKHCFYLTRDANSQAPYGDANFIPLFPSETHQPSGADLVRIIDHHKNRPFLLTHQQSGLQKPMDPGRYTRSIFAHLDGHRSFGEIFDRVRAEPAYRTEPPSDDELFANFRPWYEALQSIERLVLRRAEP
jgi:2-polyprenyl-3-methyl-5-hydroxy-6-metoxy-1,4-benzoquinol methylase